MPSKSPVRAVLFDFFGTLVTYEPDRLNLDYANTALLLHRWGYENAGERFAEVWNAVLRTLELTTSGSLKEFSMTDVVVAYDETEQLGLTLDRRAELLGSFMAEWRVGVRPIDGVRELLAELSGRVHLGIVSNTHQPELVPSLVDEFGLGAVFDPMVLSINHGHRKPHAAIYVTALEGLRRRVAAETSPTDRIRASTPQPDSAQPDPGQPDPGQPDPGQPDPGQPDPGQPDPGQPDPGRPDPGRPDPGRPDPGRPDPAQPELLRADHPRVAPPHPDSTRASVPSDSFLSDALRFEPNMLDPTEVLFVGDTYDPDYAGPMAAGFQARLIDPHHLFDIPSAHRLHSILDLLTVIDKA